MPAAEPGLAAPPEQSTPLTLGGAQFIMNVMWGYSVFIILKAFEIFLFYSSLSFEIGANTSS